MLCKHGRKHIRSGARVREKEKPFWTLGRHRRRLLVSYELIGRGLYQVIDCLVSFVSSAVGT